MSARVTGGLALGFIAIVAAIFLLAGLFLTGYVGERNDQQALVELRQQAMLAAGSALPIVTGTPATQSSGTVERISSVTHTRVTVFSVTGTPLADSVDVAGVKNQLQAPEFQNALHGSTTSIKRDDPATTVSTWYVAAPIVDGGEVAGVLRLTMPARDLGSSFSGEPGIIALMLALAAAITLLSIWVFTRVAMRPLAKIVATTKSFSGGDLSVRAPVESSGDFADLAVAFNDMADELQATIGTIELERTRLDSVVEHLGDGILIIDDQDQVALMNLSAEKLLGVKRGWAIGRTFAQVFRDYELAAVVRAGRASREGDVAPATHVIEMGRPRRSVQAFSYPIPSDQAPLVLLVLRDITEFRRTEAVRRDFVANVSHDLRTPIASMKALVETLLDGALEDESVAREFLSRMHVEVDDLARLVEELLQLSRAESGQIELRVAPGNLHTLTRHVAERMWAQASLKQIDISLDAAPDLPRALFDSDRIEQVLVNLVHNAIKFTPAGGRIEIAVRATDNEVVVSVKDSGPGLDANDLQRVFERFYKADRSRSAAGSGLGLAIAKHLVQLHGGRIWADSDYGHGSTFSFSLPRVDRAGADAAARSPSADMPGPARLTYKPDR